MAVEAGKLNRLIEILSQNTTKNSYGEPTFTYTTSVAPQWANVKPMSGSEFRQADQTMSEIQTIFQIRYSTTITPDPSMRVQYNSQDYNINAVINVGDENVMYELFCNRITT